METTLHQQLKSMYACPEKQEVVVDDYRIDAVADRRLFEIQCASLSAIRDKIKALVKKHRVVVVKPLPMKTLITKMKYSAVVSQRYSPKKATIWDLFDDFVHFVSAFPHENLELRIVFIEQEEIRRPPKRKRWRGPDYRVEDRSLLSVISETRFQTTEDFTELLPVELPMEFGTSELADHASIPRWLAQKVLYTFRKCGAVDVIGKKGNAWQYSRPGANVEAA